MGALPAVASKHSLGRTAVHGSRSVPHDIACAKTVPAQMCIFTLQ